MTTIASNETAPFSIYDKSIKNIKEAAYYTWLKRGQYAQPGNETNDWMEAEKEVRDRLKNRKISL